VTASQQRSNQRLSAGKLSAAIAKRRWSADADAQRQWFGVCLRGLGWVDGMSGTVAPAQQDFPAFEQPRYPMP